MYYAISLGIDEGITPKDSIYMDYCPYFEQFGCKLIYLPNASKSIEAYFDELPIKGLILSGGNSIKTAPLRDASEKKALDAAIKRKMPVLGICRGMHFINDYFGGDITENIDEVTGQKDSHVRKSHLIDICDDVLAELFGKREVKVNSFHHQGILKSQVARDLEIMAVCPGTDIVEAVFHPGLPLLAIQWHPERDASSKEDDKKLVNAFFNKKFYWKDK